MVSSGLAFKFSSAGKGFLSQDDAATNDKTFDHLKCNFGLIKSSWQEFDHDFRALQASADENTRYKVLFLARHGQGFHNYAIEIYGQKEWDRYWSLLDGDGKIVWGPDAELTELGIQQARDNHMGWKKQIVEGIPSPTIYYVSPMTRALDTMQYTWNGIVEENVPPPLVIEDLREDYGEHTCDKRRSRSYIHKRFPEVGIESSLTEDDELWKPDWRETHRQHNVRTDRFLQWLFNEDWESPKHNYVSITSHSGTVNSFLDIMGHRPFQLWPGGMIPVIIRAVRDD
jgi:broad specificity phosphatase PhoE